MIIAVAAATSWWALFGLLGILIGLPSIIAVLGGAVGPALIPVLKSTGLAELTTAVGLLVGLVIGSP